MEVTAVRMVFASVPTDLVVSIVSSNCVRKDELSLSVMVTNYAFDWYPQVCQGVATVGSALRESASVLKVGKGKRVRRENRDQKVAYQAE